MQGALYSTRVELGRTLQLALPSTQRGNMANFVDLSAISAVAAAFLGSLTLRWQRARTRRGTFLRPLGNLETLITAMHDQGVRAFVTRTTYYLLMLKLWVDHLPSF